jgi:hypothetical protein
MPTLTDQVDNRPVVFATLKVSGMKFRSFPAAQSAPEQNRE